MIETILAYGVAAALGLTGGGVLTYKFTSDAHAKDRKQLAQKFGEAHEAILREITRIKGLDDRAYNEAVAEVNNEEFVSQITNQLNTIAAGENLEPVSSENMQALINTLQHTLVLETFLAKVRRNHELNQILGQDHTPDDIPAHLLAKREEIKARYGNVITRQGAEIADLKSQLEAEKAQVKRIHERLRASKNESSRKSRKIIELEDAIAKLTEVNLGLVTQLNAITQKLEHMTQDNVELKSRVEEVTQDNVELKSRVEEVTQDNVELKSRVEGVTQDNVELRSRVTNLESNIQSDIKKGLDVQLKSITSLLMHIPQVKEGLNRNTEEKLANSVIASVILQAKHQEDEDSQFRELYARIAESTTIEDETIKQIQAFLNEIPEERASMYVVQFNDHLPRCGIRVTNAEEGNWIMVGEATLNSSMYSNNSINNGESFTGRLQAERTNSFHATSVNSGYAPL